MNIAKLIAKFLKSGLSSLTSAEKDLLKKNISLMSVSQKQKFEKAIDEEEKEDEEADEEDEEKGDEDVDGEEADDEENADDTEDAVDEKALQQLISKSVAKQVDKISDSLLAKFKAGAKAQRKRILANGAKEVDANKESTRDFLKALVAKDTVKLKEIEKSLREKATHFNETADDARGGYLVPEELRAEVLRIAETQYGLARREMMYLPFSGPGNSRTIPTLASSVSTFWTDEAGKKAGTNPTFDVVTQTLKKLAAIVPFTEELIEDSVVNVTQLVAQLFAEAVAKQEDLQFFMGTGSPWTGILNNGDVNDVEMAAGEGMADISFEKLVDMQDEIPSGALTGCKYYMHRHVLSYLHKLRADAVSSGDSKGMFLLPPTQQAIEDILGFPIVLTDTLPDKTLSGAGKPFVLFGNLKMAAIFGDKQQIRVKLLDQATITDADGTTAINLAEQDMLALRMEERVGYLLALPSALCVLKTGDAS